MLLTPPPHSRAATFRGGAEAELERLLRRVDRVVRDAESPTWRHYLRASAVNRIGRIQGLPPHVVRQRLRAAGFRAGVPSTRGSEVWWHPDGSRVRIDPPHRGRGNFPSDRRVHYHKYAQWPGSPVVLISDRGRAISVRRRDPATGALIAANPRRSPAAHILSGARQREAAGPRPVWP